MMLFCPKCGSILKPKKLDNKKVMACSCGFIDRKPEIKITETIRKKMPELGVVEKGEIEALPKTDAECPKCKHKKAYYWLVQTRAADEAPTKFLKCESCNYTWREYD